MKESNIILPSSPADQAKLKQMIQAAVDCKVRISSEQEASKEIVEEIVDQFELPKAKVNKIINTEFKGDFDKLQQDNDDFVQLYELISNTTT